jgi:hypothetical protein
MKFKTFITPVNRFLYGLALIPSVQMASAVEELRTHHKKLPLSLTEVRKAFAASAARGASARACQLQKLQSSDPPLSFASSARDERSREHTDTVCDPQTADSATIASWQEREQRSCQTTAERAGGSLGVADDVLGRRAQQLPTIGCVEDSGNDIGTSFKGLFSPQLPEDPLAN